MDSLSANPLRLALSGQAASRLAPGDGAGAGSVSDLTAAQQQQLAKLHDAATQMESVFVDMLFKEMRKTAPTMSITGKPSNAEETFGEMLDEKRSEELAKTGSLGIGKILEAQLRASVIGEAK